MAVGISLILRQVPLGEGVFHQVKKENIHSNNFKANAVGVLSLSLYTMHTLRKPNPRYVAYLKHIAQSQNATAQAIKAQAAKMP